MNATNALHQLIAGNKRFAAGNAKHPNQTIERREELNEGQHPFAVVISCSDSRVCPEIVFDCGLGDLFVVRSAGQVADDAELASVEYAVEHLGVELVLILGHSSCGAVGATVAGGQVNGHLAALVDAIEPALQRSENGGQAPDVDQCARENVRMQVEQLRGCEPLIRPRVDVGNLQIIGGFYDLATGEVEILEQN